MCNECLINNLLHKITKIILKSQSFSTNQSRHIGIDFHNFHPIPLQKHTTHYENKQYFKNQFTQSKQNPQTATPISPCSKHPKRLGCFRCFKCFKCFKCFRCFKFAFGPKKRLFLVQIGTKTVFQVFQSFQIRSQIPPIGRDIPQAYNGNPSPKTPHIIYIKEAYIEKEPPPVPRK